MNTTLTPESLTLSLPDHTQLPESNGTFVKNFQEHPQSILLTDSILPILDQLHPNQDYAIGQDSGIYWRSATPPERGAECPDWFYVPNVPFLLNGRFRRSYVLWKEIVAPLIVLEFVSGNGDEERDKTPPSQADLGDGTTSAPIGKFWVYEQAIRVPFYGIYEVNKASIEMYHLIDGHYQLMTPNQRGHYPIPQMGVEIGIWQGRYQQADLPWLRWWDNQGNLLLTGQERADLELLRAEQERLRAEEERQRAEQEHLRAEQASQRAEQEGQRAEQASQRAEEEHLRAEEERQRADRLAEYLRQMGVDPNQIS
jgi:Uma2 family endonuclease